MIIFLDEDRPYLYWVTHHRSGLVLDCRRNVSKSHLVLHRAICPAIKHSASKKTHWTTNPHMKACSLDAGELRFWAVGQCGDEPDDCTDCFAAPELHPEDHPLHLTKLGKEILSFVLEAAALHLDDGVGAYWLSMGMVAKCLDKTPAQLTAAVLRVVDDGLLTITEPANPGEALSTQCELVPTVAAMKTLPGYEDVSDKQIKGELKSILREEN
jgi:hypothetical protein